MKPKYGREAKLCYMDTDKMAVYLKPEDICKQIEKDVERRFDTSTYELE